jgi:arsenate reductase (thioredoxin)
VITVCGNAAGETCPAYLGKVLRAHWGVEDPAKAMGTDEEINASFEQAYQILRKRIEAFLALDAATLENQEALQKALNTIGESYAS